MSDDLLLKTQQFICEMYGHKGDDVNKVRYKLYAAKKGRVDPRLIPPCFDSLKIHFARAMYQVHIWRNCLVGHPDIPSPVGRGWDLNENRDFVIKWNSINPAPDEILNMMFCSCSRKCVSGSCQ